MQTEQALAPRVDQITLNYSKFRAARLMNPEDSDAPLDNLDALLIFLITCSAFVMRYWRIALPAGVVFDEVYFGNFTNFYIKSQFYYDIHPPLAKILMFMFANMSEYDGSINFNSCPKGYPIPDYVQLRITPATFSALCFPLMYMAMRFLRFGHAASLCGTVLALFDTSMATEGRHILSDGILHFFTCLHVAVLCFTMSMKRRRRKFWAWHILTGITLGCACSCKNTAWGLMTLDAFVYFVGLWDMMALGVVDYIGEIAFFGGSLLVICLAVYFVVFAIHFVLLPYAGRGYGYLCQEMKDQLIPNGVAGSGLFAARLKAPGLFMRSLILTLRMHHGNMGIRSFHDSQSFPKHWPWLGSVSVYFWARSGCEIRCLGNAFSYYLALLGVIACLFCFRRPNYLNALKLVVGYAVSYFPFYLIPRVLYLYHYIIPLMFGCMAFGALVEMTLPPKFRGIALVATACMVIFGYWLWSPYVYGTPMHDRSVMLWTRRWVDGDEEHRRRRAEKRNRK